MAKLSIFLLIFLISNGENSTLNNGQHILNNSELSNDGLNDSELLIQRNTSPIVLKTVEEFKWLCPWTQFCSSNSSELETSTIGSCCGSCRCDEGCGTNCCPDKPRNYLNETEVRHIKDKTNQCIQLQYKPTTDDVAFNIIAKCPSYFNEINVKEDCAREYNDFVFSHHGIFGFTPVSSSLTKTIYKNVFCARCHGENDSDIIAWQINVYCIKRLPLLLRSPEDIPNALTARDDCNILFQAPQNLAKPSVCRVDTCNTNKLLKYDNAEIESVCASYKSFYKGYKNIHCYLCNGGNRNTIRTKCPIPSKDSTSNDSEEPWSDRPPKIAFSAFLDFRSGEYNWFSSSQPDINTSCPENSQYDGLRKKCRTLICSKGLRLNEGKCKPIYNSITSAGLSGFGVTFATTPSKIIKSLKTGTYSPKVITLRNVRNLLLVDLPKTAAALVKRYITECSSTTLVKINNTLKEVSRELLDSGIKDLQNFGVQLIIIHIIFETYIVKNTSETIADFALVISNTTADVYNVIEIEHSNKHIHLLMAQISERGVICDSLIHIQPYPFCANIELTADEYRLNKDGTPQVYLNFIDSYIHLYRDVIFKTDNSGIFICHEQYLKLSKAYLIKIESNEQNYEPIQIMSMVCLSVSLLALLITFSVYFMLKELWTVPGLNIMALVLSFFVMYALTLLTECTEIFMQWLCILVGVLKHFATLSSFMWMFICTFHMMTVFKSIQRESSRKTHVFLKYAICSETMSASIVVITIWKSYITSEEFDIGYGGKFCFVHPAMILYTIFIPVCIIVVANLLMFLFVIVTICKLPDMKNQSTHERNNLMIFAKLSSLTGITWLIGIIYVVSSIDTLEYINVVLNASQGLFIMISFIINKRIYAMLRAKYATVTKTINLPSTSRTGTVTTSTVKESI